MTEVIRKENGIAIRWLDHAPKVPSPAGERTIAPEGEHVWRRSLWPADDDLFDLPAPAAGAGLVLAGGSEGRRAEVEAALTARSIAVAVQASVSDVALRDADVVLLLPADGSSALPAQAPSVLAARRLLIAPRAEITFGLAAGLHYLAFSRTEEAVDLVESARRVPYAYAPMRIWGAHAAERHRASAVYARLARDLELEGVLGRDR